MSEDIVAKASEEIVELRGQVEELKAALAEALDSNRAFRDRLYQYRMLSAECDQLYDDWFGEEK